MLHLFQTFTTMSLTTLKDDLLAEFREERIMINDQLEILDPLGTSLRMPAAQNLYSSSTLFIAEFVCYAGCAGAVAFAVAMHNIYPFNLLNTALYNPELRSTLGGPNITFLSAAIYALVGIVAIGLFVIAQLVRSVRLKNEVLRHAGRDVKTIVSQHLLRRAAMEAIEQRHLLATTGIVQIPPSTAKASASATSTANERSSLQNAISRVIPA